MIGKVIGVEENIVFVELSEETISKGDLIHRYVYFKNNEKDIVGEIVNLKEKTAEINLVGEMVDEHFVSGVIGKPSFSSKVELIEEEKVKGIISVEDYDDSKDLYLGKSPIYKDTDKLINLEKHEIKVSDKEDIVIDGLGFIKVMKKTKLNVYTLKGVKVYTRKSFL